MVSMATLGGMQGRVHEHEWLGVTYTLIVKPCGEAACLPFGPCTWRSIGEAWLPFDLMADPLLAVDPEY